GANTCNAAGTGWSGCVGEVTPQQEVCPSPFDEDCDGDANELGGQDCECVDGQTTPCYTGAPDTLNVGICQAGARTCTAGIYGACTGQVLPAVETCATAADDDCDGSTLCAGMPLWSKSFGDGATDQQGSSIAVDG